MRLTQLLSTGHFIKSLGLTLLLTINGASQAQLNQVPEIPAFLPMITSVPASQPMPIDGTWTISSIGKRVRIQAGRVSAVDPWLHMFVLKIQPGMVVIKNITPTAPAQYKGEDLPLLGQWNASVQPDGSLSVQVAGKFGPVSYQMIPVNLDNQAWHQQEMQRAGLISAPMQQQSQPSYHIPPPQAQGSTVQTAPTYTPPVYSIPQPSTDNNAGYGRDRREPPPPQNAEESEAVQEYVNAIYLGKTDKWSCKGINNYYTPNNGGECWECPTGYHRSTKKIYKPNSCIRIGNNVQKLINPNDKEVRVDATKVGKAKKWGCQGKQLYFTPRNGGECWSCPPNYKRTTKKIYEEDSCVERGLGFDKKRTDAQFVRSVYGCEKGQFHHGFSCYRCPTGYKKVAVLGVFNPGKACTPK